MMKPHEGASQQVVELNSTPWCTSPETIFMPPQANPKPWELVSGTAIRNLPIPRNTLVDLQTAIQGCDLGLHVDLVAHAIAQTTFYCLNVHAPNTPETVPIELRSKAGDSKTNILTEEGFVQNFWASMYSEVKRNVSFWLKGKGELINDVTQEVMRIVVEKMKTYSAKNGASVKTWVSSICRNTAWRARRLGDRWTSISDDEAAVDEFPALEAPMDLDKLLEGMPEDERQILILWAQELTLEEIGVELGMPRSTVHYKYHQALARIRSKQ